MGLRAGQGTVMIRKARQQTRKTLLQIQARLHARAQSRYAQDLSFTAAAKRFPDRSEMYRYMYHYFHNLAPQALREHRTYFSQEGRGFGEDAFHAMWFTLLREFKPRTCLEIGVYRGQTISLWGLVSKLIGFDCDLHGISPFSSAGDEASRYSENVDYLTDTQQSFRKFSAKIPRLVKAYSTDPQARAHIAAHSWDMIYIDGSHDYEIVLADYEICRDHLAPGGLLVMDDSSLYTDYRPPLFGFAGHPGPSRVLRDFAMKELRFLGAVGHNNVLCKE